MGGLLKKRGNIVINKEYSDIKHVAFIMDGNGRWAKARSMPRVYGHSAGADNFRKIVRFCGDLGIDDVTVYAFSTENWKRPESEVKALMDIFLRFISEAKKDLDINKVNIIFIGDRNPLSEKLKREMDELEKISSVYKRKLCIALNYGGHSEIVNAVNSLIESGKTQITEDDITQSIWSGICPPPDMIIRTGGEIRLSNFLLWQSYYSELFFTETLWPDFTCDELIKMLEEFKNRKRRFGGI